MRGWKVERNVVRVDGGDGDWRRDEGCGEVDGRVRAGDEGEAGRRGGEVKEEEVVGDETSCVGEDLGGDVVEEDGGQLEGD